MSLPRVAYVTLWFPKPSETFIFREVKTLAGRDLPVKVFTLYAPLGKGLSREMRAFPASETLGTASLPKLLGTFLRHCLTRPARTWVFLRDNAFNGFRSLEGLGENLWAVLCGLHLARRFEAEGIEHIHAPWANGPATAARVASKLTGIPYSFAGRAGDIYPAEGALPGKIADAAFVRVNHGANVAYLRSLAPGHAEKIVLVYNSLSLLPETPERAPGGDTFRLLAAGRFVPKKGFDDLLAACALLRDRGLDFTLTLAGHGRLAGSLKQQAKRLDLTGRVRFPGFLKHDELSELMRRSDALVMPCVIGPNGDRDGIPNVIMEAYAHGLPVIATDVAGIGEVVADGETGCLVGQHDPDALAGAILRLAAAPDEAARLAGNGRQRVLSMFDQEINARKLRELFSAHSK
ncbi:GDP-mannose-dependent alpha-(1-6)-phosphatidylinositol monomannoside mannosyltransferase [Pseudodesulfovibrio hydrargyri]|uniref:GDP-mannose-dependent alpha-(1-6)-phosphatidylinositol monomannoside mannosyltransferase n=1 Tax=Pseudodesulfovibrio hydrargyri TaxID=2125990 RepID=A0A1J5MSQ9_9BACT|nr:glycosyltransferase family 4 protein [Pseudodesulfovibrio hydrargyri]OIQ49042.1 GDP-mannose-dependent alpha-(1-6)-phosphatidylinositol monomannoside mannosyltransferase [Pseudodesulfovibrio hydrargyri]